METLPKSPLLKFPPDNLKVVRKAYDLDGPGRMKEAVDILEEWIKQQQHFVKKDFSRDYLEITIVCCKGSIERAKQRLDKACTLRTFMKNMFGNYDLKNDLNHVLGEKFIFAPVATLTKENYRVLVSRFNKMLDAKDFMDMYRSVVIYFEYLRVHDYANGYVSLCDFGNLNVLEYATKINPVELRHVMTTIVEGYGVRLKGIYLLCSSSLIEAIISIFKKVVSEKLGNRIFVVKTIEEFYEYFSKEILPEDYGGNEKSLAELHADWIEELSSKEFTQYRKDMNEASTDETLRSVYIFNDQHMGVPGTFRTLSLD